MDKNLLEDRKSDWLAEEYKREKMRNNLDLDNAKKLKDEHYREHKGKNEDDLNFFNVVANLGIAFVILALFVLLFYEMAEYLFYCLKGF